MDRSDGEDGSIALLSVHPEYVKRMVNGEKLVEFRRAPFARRVSHVVVYSTRPEKRLVGYFEVDGVYEDSPSSLWRKHNKRGGISRERLLEYLEGGRQTVAIVMSRFHPFRKDLGLEDIGVARPPQSFRYLDRSVLETLKSYT